MVPNSAICAKMETVGFIQPSYRLTGKTLFNPSKPGTDSMRRIHWLLRPLLLCILVGNPFLSSNAQSAEGATSFSSVGTSATSAVTKEDDVRDWFSQYDQIRRNAKMSFRDKLQSRKMLALALSPFIVSIEGSEQLIKRMSSRYADAIESMKNLPSLPATEKLRLGYLKYFTEAKQLFIDISKVPMDDSRRRYVSELLERKKSLETLDHDNKTLDADLRKQFSIPPFRG
jgi:hypothetical protein